MKFFAVFALFVAAVSAGVADSQTRDWRIVGGEDALDRVPYQISMRNRGSHSCGGSIIAPRWIVTAAHCIISANVRDLQIYVGSNRRSSGGTSYDVVRKITHERYNSPNYHNDIGLLQTALEIQFNENVQPIKLRQAYVPDKAFPIRLTGWGRLSAGGAIPEVLQSLLVQHIDYDECKRLHGGSNDVGVGHLCTFTRSGEGACNGDSGGPLVHEGELVALVNWGIPCGRGYPDAHARISTYYDWVWENAKD